MSWGKEEGDSEASEESWQAGSGTHRAGGKAQKAGIAAGMLSSSSTVPGWGMWGPQALGSGGRDHQVLMHRHRDEGETQCSLLRETGLPPPPYSPWETQWPVPL